MCIPKNDASSKKVAFKLYMYNLGCHIYYSYIPWNFASPHLHHLLRKGTVQDSVHSFHSAHVPRLESNSAIRSSWEAKAVTSVVLVEPIWGQMVGWMDGWKGWRPGQGVDDMVVRSTETKRKRISDFFTWNYWLNKINYIGILISWFIDNPPING